MIQRGMHGPTAEQIRAAFDGGAPVRFGVVCYVPMGTGTYAIANLVAAKRGDPDPYYVVTRFGNVVVVSTSTDRGMSVAGLVVHAGDEGPCSRALSAMPPETDRHTEGGDERRLQAGQHAMKCSDSMLRARLLDEVDGWRAILGKVVDHDPKHGTLHESADRSLTVRLLRVKCPSTGRIYVLRVPAALDRASAARVGTFNGRTPTVES